jgi:signal transduction histidine kinase
MTLVDVPEGTASPSGVPRRPSTSPADAPRVLVIDDEEALREAYARQLARHGYRVEAAHDAETALVALRDAAFDLVVSDITMPGMSGIELVAHLRASKLDVPVILVTGAPNVDTAMRAVAQGVSRYLTKPVERQTLLDAADAAVRLHGLARAKRLALDNESLRALVDELGRAREAAEAGSRSKSAFLAMMSHELRTPMTAVLGYADLVLDGTLSEDQRDWMRRVRGSAALSLKLLQHLLDMADLAGGDALLTVGTFDPKNALAAVVTRFEPEARAKGLALGCEIDERAPMMRGDATKIVQIVEHLLSNAIKFTERGRIDVRAELERRSGRLALVRVSVADTGIGIPEESLACVLEPFVQVDASSTRRFGGAGLGLAISSALARLMGGTLEVESRVGSGTRVSFAVQLEMA